MKKLCNISKSQISTKIQLSVQETTVSNDAQSKETVSGEVKKKQLVVNWLQNIFLKYLYGVLNRSIRPLSSDRHFHTEPATDENSQWV